MIKLIQFLFSGCWHKWDILEKIHLTMHSEFGGRPSTGYRYYIQCKRCGTVKKKDLA